MIFIIINFYPSHVKLLGIYATGACNLQKCTKLGAKPLDKYNSVLYYINVPDEVQKTATSLD